MTTTWACPECGADNSLFVPDCGTCGAPRPKLPTGGVLSAEVLQNTESLGELRIALREQGTQLEAMKDSLGELWVQVDSLKSRVDGLEARMDVFDDECGVTVTAAPVFLDDVRYEVTHD